MSTAELKARLIEAEETLDAIRNGDVDAVVVGGPAGQMVYTLENADRPYRALIEQMQEGALTLAGDGTVLYCNQRFSTLVDMPRGTIIGEGVTRFFSPNEADAFHQLLTRDLGAGASREFALRAAEGVEVPVNISLVDLKVDQGMLRVICGVVTDLTLNRGRTQELAAANGRLASEIEERVRTEESLRLALDAADMGSWDLDLEIGTTRRSLRHDQIFGHSQLLPTWRLQAVFDQFVAEDRESVTRAFAEAETSGSIEFERRIRRADDGALRWLHVKGQTYYEAGKPVRIAGVVTDVTDRRAVEEQLRQAQKMEAVGQLTGGIAHDFNNLLTGISGSLELLQVRMTQGRLSDVERYLTTAQGAAKRAASLTHRLLAFSRLQTLDPKATDINRLVADMGELIRRTVGPYVEVEVIGAAGLWPTLVDPNQLESALLNLCINGRDAMPDGGRLTIATANIQFDEHAAGERELPPGQYLSLCVTDTGTGMTPEVIKRAFDPFFTTKPLGAGTGLGLSMVYGFARQSCGQVRIDSELGQGTTMYLYLPRYHGAAQDAAESGESVLAPRAEKGESVLVVEDEPAVRMLITDVLDDLGYSPIEAEDGAAALKVLQSDASIDLLITDVGLPGGMNGRQIADAGRALRPELKVLFITGYAENAVIGAGGLGAGMQILAKPFAMDALAIRIKEFISGK